MTRDVLVVSHLKLAYWAAAEAYRHSQRTVPYEELRAEALLHLCQAADSFQPQRGLAFSTYAGHIMRFRLRDFVLRYWHWPIVIPPRTCRANRPPPCELIPLWDDLAATGTG